MNPFIEPTMEVVSLSEEVTNYEFLTSANLQTNELGIVGKITKPQ